jgi:hypothetical protein
MKKDGLQSAAAFSICLNKCNPKPFRNFKVIIEIIRNTPIWVWFLFVGLVVYGIQLSRPSKVKQHTIFILPVVIFAMSLSGVLSAFSNAIMGATFWIIGIITSIALFSILNLAPVGRYLKQEKTFEIFGSWLPLTLMMSIFSTKYVVGVATAMQLDILHTDIFISIISGLYGAFSGVFIYRCIALLRIKHMEIPVVA